uniref:BTB domain-containing protein n=1 Tax=Panagrolaimus sp. ES5 TaxID=591445 RepID=A0AC34FIH9_9BILA
MASNKRQKLQPENGACCECVCHGKSDEDDAAQSNVYKMQLQRYEIFKSQDGEKGHFDVTFMVGGKKIFANKHVLASISEPLNTMLSNRWFKNEDSVVEIKTCHYAGFHQFLCFVYSGKCMVTEENVFQLIDLAQSYDFCILKNFCDTFLSNIEYNVRKAYKMLEVSQTYSLKQCTESLKIYVEKNWKEVIDFDKFLLLEKSSVVLLSSFKRASNEEESFQNAVFKWAEHQGLVKQKAKNDESFNLDDAIKAELTDILPLLLLNNVNAEATQKFINKHRDWFSASESYQILRQSKDSKENIFKAVT